MALVGKDQPVTLYVAGDPVYGKVVTCRKRIRELIIVLLGASFDNFLDAIDGSFCTFEGGDDPMFDWPYPDPSNATGAYKGMPLFL